MRLLSILAVVCPALVSCVPSAESAPSCRGCNLLMISVDTLRADHLGVYGYPRNTSPSIDRFSERAVVFDQFFSVVPKTGPSMATLFTGKLPYAHGVIRNAGMIVDSHRTLAESLPASYTKAAFVGSIVLNEERGYSRGFDEYEVGNAPPDFTTERALEWLQERREPFFLWLHYLDPHGPYTPPQRLAKRFEGDDFYDATRTVPLRHDGLQLDEYHVLGAIPGYQRLSDIDVVDYYVAQYDAEILFTDEQIGRVLDLLERSGMIDRTLVVLTADHGESLGEHGYYFEHGMLVNEPSIRIPLIIRHPRLRGGRRVRSLGQNTDLLPTLAAELEFESTGEIDGLPLALREGTQGKRQHVYSHSSLEYLTFYDAIRTPDGKLVRASDGKLNYYDLDADPAESENVIDDLPTPKRRELVEILDRLASRRDEAEVVVPQLPDAFMEQLRTLGYVQ